MNPSSRTLALAAMMFGSYYEREPEPPSLEEALKNMKTTWTEPPTPRIRVNTGYRTPKRKVRVSVSSKGHHGHKAFLKRQKKRLSKRNS